MPAKPIKVQIERWTPQQALEALALNEVNRNLREPKVNIFARDMTEGRWTFCPDPITFNSKGKLINGQHRLNAQISAGKTISWVVVREAPNEVQKTMDTGTSRNLKDLLAFEGIHNTTTVGAVARLCLQMETGRIYVQKKDATASNTEVLEFVKETPDVIHSAVLGRDMARSGILNTRPSALGAAHWWIAKHAGIGEADEFLYRIGKMVGEKDGSPVIALVRGLNSISRNKTRIETRWLVYMILKAWNYDVAGTQVNRIEPSTKDGEYRLLTPQKRGSTAGIDDE